MSNQIPNPLPETLPAGTTYRYPHEDGGTIVFRITADARLLRTGDYAANGGIDVNTGMVFSYCRFEPSAVDWSSLPQSEPKRTRIPAGSVLVSRITGESYELTTAGFIDQYGRWCGKYRYAAVDSECDGRLIGVIREEFVDWTRSTIPDEPKREECEFPGCDSNATRDHLISRIRQRRTDKPATVPCLDCGKSLTNITVCEDSQGRQPLCSECWPKSDERLRAGTGLVVPKPVEPVDRAAAPDNLYQGRVTLLCPCGAQLYGAGRLCGDCRRERDKSIIRAELDKRIAVARDEVDPIGHIWSTPTWES